MIKITYSFFLFFCFLGLAYSGRGQELFNTTWSCKYGDCKDYYKFADSNKYKFYSCETGNMFTGSYYLKSDTVTVEQLSGERDSDFPQNSIHRASKIRIRLIIINNQMHPIERWELNRGKWLKSDFKFDSNYIFNKEEY